MASEPIYGKGIVVASGFDLSAKSPLDTRSVVNTIAERDEHVTYNRAYNGMTVYVLEEQKEYRFNGYIWVEMLNDLSAVHSHHNQDVLDSITAEDISKWNAKSDFSGSYKDLSDVPTLPTKLSDLSNDIANPYASQSYVLAEIAKAQLEGEEIDLSGYATKDDLDNYALYSDISGFVTWDDMEAQQYADITYVDNRIVKHSHDTISDTEIDGIIKETF